MDKGGWQTIVQSTEEPAGLLNNWAATPTNCSYSTILPHIATLQRLSHNLKYVNISVQYPFGQLEYWIETKNHLSYCLNTCSVMFNSSRLHGQLSGNEFEQTLGDSARQGKPGLLQSMGSQSQARLSDWTTKKEVISFHERYMNKWHNKV